jgi:hypothetical protein
VRLDAVFEAVVEGAQIERVRDRAVPALGPLNCWSTRTTASVVSRSTGHAVRTTQIPSSAASLVMCCAGS